MISYPSLFPLSKSKLMFMAFLFFFKNQFLGIFCLEKLEDSIDQDSFFTDAFIVRVHYLDPTDCMERLKIRKFDLDLNQKENLYMTSFIWNPMLVHTQERGLDTTSQFMKFFFFQYDTYVHNYQQSMKQQIISSQMWVL